ncbi:MAG: hypothetical protein NTU63_00100 [Candidatus Pacearchaeota archaeon]|nr:hypothetical protein [Candidatus Pacearchaeota archaeon]
MKQNLESILNQMKRKKRGLVYQGELPEGIIGIKRISTRSYDYSEVIFKKLDEKTVFQIAENFGLEHEKKRRTDDLRCEHCPLREECISVNSDGESSRAYTIIKPRKFWFPDVIMDVVYNSVRIYDTKRSIEIGSRIINEYLN